MDGWCIIILNCIKYQQTPAVITSYLAACRLSIKKTFCLVAAFLAELESQL